MSQWKDISLRYPSEVYQKLVRQRMDLEEFHEWAGQFIEALVDVQHRLIEEKASLSSAPHLSTMSTHLLRIVSEAGELCKHFHDCIEFSSHLPLSVVPFLLPLIASLKRAGTQVSYLKSYLTENHLQAEDYRAIRSSIAKLDNACYDIVNHTRFLFDQARFREKSA